MLKVERPLPVASCTTRVSSDSRTLASWTGSFEQAFTYGERFGHSSRITSHLSLKNLVRLINESHRPWEVELAILIRKTMMNVQ